MNYDLKPGLYLAASPIGNMDDITLRVLRTLNAADLIACEDTRNTKKLCRHYDINKPLISHHAHNEHESAERIINEIKNGKIVVFLSDAGMPGISDPGSYLLKAAKTENCYVTVLPGASAFITALVFSGKDTQNFKFIGFLDTKNKIRKEQLENIKNTTETLVLYEAPHKLVKTLKDLKTITGNRSISIVRELTKIYEECLDFENAEKAYEYYVENQPRGEIVIIIDGFVQKSKKLNDQEIKKLLLIEIEKGNSIKDSVNIIKDRYNLKKNDVYKISLDI